MIIKQRTLRKTICIGLALALLALSACGGSNPLEFAVSPETGDDIVGECSPTLPESGMAATAAAQELIDIVGGETLVYPIDAPQRYTWSVLPVPIVTRPDQGARMGDLSDAAKDVVCKLVDSTLSDSGVEIVFGSMSSDEFLGITGARSDREYTKDNYWISIFGDPSGDGIWAYQLEGHHLGINIAIRGDSIVAGPNLYGGYPLMDEDGTPFLIEQEAAALAFMESLTDEQRSTAVISNTPSEVDVSSENAGYEFLEPSSSGIVASSLDTNQQDALMTLIDSFAGTLPPEQANQVRALIADELDEAILSWEGPTDAKPFGFLQDVYAYDPTSDSWEARTPCQRGAADRLVQFWTVRSTWLAADRPMGMILRSTIPNAMNGLSCQLCRRSEITLSSLLSRARSTPWAVALAAAFPAK